MQNAVDTEAKWKQWLAHREQEWRQECMQEERDSDYDEEIEEQLMVKYAEQERQFGEEWESQ